MEECLVSHDFIIASFCCVDDLRSQVTQGKRIRQGGFTPGLTDSEVIGNGNCRGISGNRNRQRNLELFPRPLAQFVSKHQK